MKIDIDLRSFENVLYSCYFAVSRGQRAEYVSLHTVRDMVMLATRIDKAQWQELLQRAWNDIVKSQGTGPYGISLEVDATPTERARRRHAGAAVIDGTPRWVIAMRAS